MPYITEKARKALDPEIDKLTWYYLSKGDIVYIITRLLHNYIQKRKLNFNTLCDCEGICGCAAKEFYRQVTAKREDQKKQENGPVSELDE